VHDADLEYSPSDIASLFNISKKYPDALILGSRTQGVKNRKKIYKSLVIINKFFAIFFSILNNYKISDIATCYLLVPTEFLKQQINAEKGFGIEVEILSKFLKYHNQIIEFPISYNGRRYADGKKIKITDGLVIFYKIISYSKFISLFKF
jgi:dolichol-phosphate mannosyltransferase